MEHIKEEKKTAAAAATANEQTQFIRIKNHAKARPLSQPWSVNLLPNASAWPKNLLFFHFFLHFFFVLPFLKTLIPHNFAKCDYKILNKFQVCFCFFSRAVPFTQDGYVKKQYNPKWGKKLNGMLFECVNSIYKYKKMNMYQK